MRESELYLRDILDAIEKIEDYLSDMNSKSELESNGLVSDAVVRNLEIIGEAVKNLPMETRKERKDIDWKKIAGLRDILTHAYFGIDYAIIWDITQSKLPKLKSATLYLLEDQ